MAPDRQHPHWPEKRNGRRRRVGDGEAEADREERLKIDEETSAPEGRCEAGENEDLSHYCSAHSNVAPALHTFAAK